MNEERNDIFGSISEDMKILNSDTQLVIASNCTAEMFKDYFDSIN